jgi:AmmeMemoRadiSam system protein A
MPKNKGQVLLTIARAAISEALGLSLNGFMPQEADWLQEKGACFVALKLNGNLRGCIGSLEAHRPLLEDLHTNAVSAALHDPRFSPLTEGEFNKVCIEVSLLSPLRQLKINSEAEALARFEPGRDGVVFQYGEHRATFLPHVWEQLPDPAQFLGHLRLKAGLAADFWHADVLIYTYRVEKFAEQEKTGQE